MGERMNKRRKALTTMRKAREFAEKQGYLVEQTQHTRYKKDFFNLFDQIWLKKGEVVFVQIKTNQSITKELSEKFINFSKKYGIATMIINYKQDKKLWEMRKFIPFKEEIIEKYLLFNNLWMKKQEGGEKNK